MDQLIKFVGNRLKELRKTKGWTQERLSQESGINHSYIADVERGDFQLFVLILCAKCFLKDEDISSGSKVIQEEFDFSLFIFKNIIEVSTTERVSFSNSLNLVVL
ncbi:helix-turn-helix transcriptional regulator [Bacillus pumilus]|nr:helix-turn-helix transcriptional regulator [Bacillus pumilus]